jgi:hypothetical protein
VRDIGLSFSAKADEKILDVLKPRTTAQKQALLHVIGCVLAADQSGRWVSYSRSNDWYTGRKRYYGPHYGRRPILSVVDLLSKAGLIDNRIVPPGTNNLVQSRMRATPRLLRVMAGSPIVPVRHPEVLVLRGDDRNLIAYRETKQTRLLRRQVLEINESLGDIRLDHPSGQRIDEHCIVIPIGDGRVCVLALDPYVIRRFCRGCFEKGGRFYGSFGSYQLLPSAVRSELLINGKPVVLLDFAAQRSRSRRPNLNALQQSRPSAPPSSSR